MYLSVAFCGLTQDPFFDRRRRAMPAEVVEFSERQQDSRNAAQQEDEADTGPQKRSTRGMIPGQRIVGEIVGVGMRGVGALGHGPPGGPREEGRELAKLLRIGDQVGRQAAVEFRVLEVDLPAGHLVGKCFRPCRQECQGAGRRIVTIGLQKDRDLAVDGSAFDARKRVIFLSESVLREATGEIERPVVKDSRAEIRTKISAMAPDGAVAHQAVFQEDFLPGTYVVAGENDSPGGVDHPVGDGWGILISLLRQQDQNGEAQDEGERDGAPPPRRQLFDIAHCGKIRPHARGVCLISDRRSTTWPEALKRPSSRFPGSK